MGQLWAAPGLLLAAPAHKKSVVPEKYTPSVPDKYPPSVPTTKKSCVKKDLVIEKRQISPMKTTSRVFSGHLSGTYRVLIGHLSGTYRAPIGHLSVPYRERKIFVFFDAWRCPTGPRSALRHPTPAPSEVLKPEGGTRQPGAGRNCQELPGQARGRNGASQEPPGDAQGDKAHQYQNTNRTNKSKARSLKFGTIIN